MVYCWIMAVIRKYYIDFCYCKGSCNRSRLTTNHKAVVNTLCALTFQIRTDSLTDRRIHNLETELSKLRLLHNLGKDKLRELKREITHYQTVSLHITATKNMYSIVIVNAHVLVGYIEVIISLLQCPLFQWNEYTYTVVKYGYCKLIFRVPTSSP